MEPYLLSPETKHQPEAIKPLAFLSIYRLILAGIFLLLYLTHQLFPPLGSQNPALFVITSLAWFVFGIIALLMLYEDRVPFALQAYTQVLIDIAAITVLMHASGGVQSGLGSLIVISIASGSIIMGGRSALLYAALATIALLLEQIYVHLEAGVEATFYPVSGLLGVTFFATAVLVHFLARRITESEALAQQRGVDLAGMAQLTRHIIQRMQTGILVIDHQQHIRLINESAQRMLGISMSEASQRLAVISPALSAQMESWQQNPEHVSQTFRAVQSHIELMPRFARLSQEAEPGTLIFLEDTSAMAQQAQQLQLASLGRLAASIAHEIRNPLGAISHAGQLLAESPQLDKHDQRLTQIIADHSQRLNTIVESIMQASRRQPSHIEIVSLKDFVQDFIQEYTTLQQIEPATIAVDIRPDDIQIRFDVGHLRQILVNLCDNGLRHSLASATNPRLEIRGGIATESARPYLDILDHGKGIDAESARHIFEPFFTTSHTGSGLGLYISRELAEGNQAHLQLLPATNDGACFRITFQDPRRHIE